MSPRLKTTGKWLTVVFVLFLPILISLGQTGCGRDQSADKQHAAVRAGSTRSGSGVAIPGPRATGPTALDPSQVASTPEPPREVTYEEAEKAYLDRDYAKAVQLFTRYTENKNTNPWGFYMLGLSAWKAGDPSCAETAFEQALALDSLHVKSYLNLSRVLLDTHRPGDALEKIDRALALEPTSNDAYRLKGRALRQQGELDDAIAAYQHALALDNEDAWSMNNLALILIESKQFDKALPPLARAVEIDAEVPIFWNNLGMALEGMGRFRAAQEAYQAALDNDASYFKASMNVTRVAAVQEEPDLEPVDLPQLARAFVGEVAGWTEQIIARSEPEIRGPADPSQTAADSVIVRGRPMASGGQRP